MTQATDPDQTAKNRVRALRRARRYIRANEGALARLLNAYSRISALDPSRKVWLDQ
ncbi:MAG: hypothetical protein AAFQ19_01710 [Pseudomonadota bacterium]